MSKFYLTNAIAYVNAPPHIGHALELVQGDALTRYHRMIGDDVRFLVGTDEHGSKIQQSAVAQGKEPQVLVDENAAHFLRLHDALGAQYDDFIRTSSDRHKKGAQKLWRLIDAAGKFYEKEYEGLYCSGCESFLNEKDLVDGKCVHHLREPELLRESNIFFRLSEYTDILREKIESGEFVIKPISRKNEILSFLKDGLQDVSFSRPKKSLSWGIEVPGREDHVMYVWCDALSNYLTALGSDLQERYWPADVHLIGKDITRFHCCFWPAMLLAADLPMPRAVYAHGFITSDGQKMSKSLGNVVDPFEVLELYGVSAVRWYLLREIPTGDDGDFSHDRFKALYADELQNTIGNLMRRVQAMIVKYFSGKIPIGGAEWDAFLKQSELDYAAQMEDFNIRAAIEVVLKMAREANAAIENEKPWSLAKSDPARLNVVLGDLHKVCRKIAHLLLPIIPEVAGEILKQIGEKEVVMDEKSFFPPLAP